MQAEGVCIVTALIVPEAEAEDPRERVQLGPLCIAASLRRNSHAVDLVDLNAISPRHRGDSILLDQHGLIADAATEILACNRRIIGLGSICSSFRMTLRLAQELKRRAPDAFVFLGGPQASAVDEAVLASVPEVDAVLRGEADTSVVTLVEILARGGSLAEAPGLSWRQAGGVVRNPDAALVELDELPLPAYELAPAQAYRGGIPIDAGRGCPFGCSFCSTNEFFRRRFRMKSPMRLVDEILTLNRQYGVTKFSLTHDLFTTNPKLVDEICAAFEQHVHFAGFEWTASARIDSMKDGLVERMRRAGCRSLFFGVESGSQRVQSLIKKRLTVARVAEVIRACSDAGIESTASIIVGHPGETREDVRQSIALAVEVTRWPRVKSQIHLLVPLPGTPIAKVYAEQLQYSDLSSNIATLGGSELSAEERAFILANPLMFTQHFYVPADSFPRRELFHIAQVTFFGLSFMRHTCLALDRHPDGFYGFAVAWSNWALHGVGTPDQLLEAYYHSERFIADFADFARAYARTWDPPLAAALATALTFDQHIRAHLAGAYCVGAGQTEAPAKFDLEANMVRADGVSLMYAHHDLHALIEALRDGGDLGPQADEPIPHLFIEQGEGRLGFSVIDPEIAQVLESCERGRCLREALQPLELPPPERGALLMSLAKMVNQGLLVQAPS